MIHYVYCTTCFIVLALVDGGYNNWTLKDACNVTCGEGFDTWTRDCKNPQPKFGGRDCSHLGEPVENRPCSARPCVGE